MMVEPAPTSAFVVPQAQFILEFLVITFDAPPHLCYLDELLQGG